jgi:ribosomal-protein-alanine N-acetyltransferase
VASQLIDPRWRPPTLTLPRLTLRDVRETDIDQIYLLARNPNVARYLLWNAHTSRDDALAYYRDLVLPKYLEGVPEPFAVCLHDGPLIGVVGARWAARNNLCMEMGYWFGEEYWGHGYATEAGRAVLQWLFATYTVERVQAHCVTENAASEKVLRKIGMRHEGTARSALNHRQRFWDLHWFAALRSDPGITADARTAG